MAALQFWWVFDLEFWSIVVFIFFAATVIKIGRKPLVGGMRSREKQIVNSLKQAEIAAEEMRQIREDFERRRREAKLQAEETIAEATRDAAHVKADIIERAKAEADRQKARHDREVMLYSNKAKAEIWQTAANVATDATEKMLRADLKADDHRRLVDDAIAEIGNLAEVN